jgi:hypothetical protein
VLADAAPPIQQPETLPNAIQSQINDKASCSTMCFAVIGLKLAQRRLSSSLKNHPEATLRKKEKLRRQ